MFVSREEGLARHALKLEVSKAKPDSRSFYQISTPLNSIHPVTFNHPVVAFSTSNLQTFSTTEFLLRHETSSEQFFDKEDTFIFRDRFILCRSIAKPVKISEHCYHLLVDDPDGKFVAPVHLNNVAIDLPGSGFPYASPLIPIGTILAISSPIFRKTPSFLVLNCSNPCHFNILPNDHPLLTSIKFKVALENDESNVQSGDPNKVGVNLFVSKQYKLAIEQFSRAISNRVGNLGSSYINRSAAYLETGRPDLALIDAETGLNLCEKLNAKLVLRKAKSLFKISRFEECLDFIQNNPFDEENSSKLPEYGLVEHRAKIALCESRFGSYPLLEIRDEARRWPYLENHGEFFSKDLLIEKGAFISPRKEVEPGSLLIATRAFAFCPITENDPSSFSTLTVKLAKTALFSIENVRKTEAQPENNDLSNPVLAVDVRGKVFGCGIWQFPGAYLRQSFDEPNCFASFLGDFIFIRAVKMIKPGDPLSISPISSSLTPFFWNSAFNASFPCELDAINSLCDEIFDILKEHEEKMYSTNEIVSKLHSVLEDFREFSAVNGDKFVVTLTENRVRYALALLYDRKENYEKAASTMERVAGAYKRLGLLGDFVICAEFLAFWYGKLFGAEAEAKSDDWYRRRLATARLIYGDERLVMKRFDPISNK